MNIVGFSVEYRRDDNGNVSPSSMMDPEAFLALYAQVQQDTGTEDVWIMDAEGTTPEDQKFLQRVLRGYASYFDIDIPEENE